MPSLAIDRHRNSDVCFTGETRFVFKPTADVEKKVSEQTKEVTSDISNLKKKLHYLETTHKNSRDHIDQIFKTGRRS